MKKVLRLTLIVLLAAAAVFTAVLAANETAPVPGGEGDPLVTLSYLEQVFSARIGEELRSDMDAKLQTLKGELEERIAALEAASLEVRDVAASVFRLIVMENGQVLTGERGVEILLRIGSASVAASSSPGLVDATTAGMLDDGAALEKNHLYMVTIPGNGIKAVGNNVMLLVRGEFTVS